MVKKKDRLFLSHFTCLHSDIILLHDLAVSIFIFCYERDSKYSCIQIQVRRALECRGLAIAKVPLPGGRISGRGIGEDDC